MPLKDMCPKICERELASGSFDGDEGAVRLSEFHNSIYEGEECIIYTSADVFTGVPFRAALSDDDAAGFHELACTSFNAEALTV